MPAYFDRELIVEEYSPLETFRKAVRLWRLVALLSFAGGALGWGFTYLQPPIYEAKAVIVAQIDFTQTGVLTELEQDQAMGAVLALFVSTPVLQAVMEDAQAEQIPLVGLGYEQNLFLERRRSNLNLKIRDRDPQVAARIANLWAENAYQALLESHQHALNARRIQQMLSPYTGCPTPAPGETACPSLVPEQERPALEAELNRELLASNGILPAMIFDLSQAASAPIEPVALRPDLLPLAGALAGFLLGIAIADIWIPRRS